jgi:hypothetical protein
LIIYVVDLTIIKQVLEIYAYYTMKCGKPVITMALKNGVDVKDVATMVGNSPEIIYRHYAGPFVRG